MKGYKTVIFNVVMSAIMVFTLWNQEAAQDLPSAAEVQGLIDQGETWITAVWAIGNVMLRAVTNTAIFQKE